MNKIKSSSFGLKQTAEWPHMSIRARVTAGVALTAMIASAAGGYMARGQDVSAAEAAGRNQASIAASQAARDAQTATCQVYEKALKQDASDVASIVLNAANENPTGMTISGSPDKTIRLDRESQEQKPNLYTGGTTIERYIISIAFTPQDPTASGKATFSVSSILSAELKGATGTREIIDSGGSATKLVADGSESSLKSIDNVNAADKTRNLKLIAGAFYAALDMTNPKTSSFYPITISKSSTTESSVQPADLQNCAQYENTRAGLAGVVIYGPVGTLATAAAKAVGRETN